ncbi:MAG: hypothetical protein KDK24_05625 [Pseudooceanicola sp.]|nr:hypothetical protein [Pseudooceanicola sp.]
MIDEKVRVWIIAMFKALELGDPVFEEAEPVAEPETGATGEDGEARQDKPPPEDLTGPRAVLAARLDKVAIPDRLPEDEAGVLQQQIDSIRKVLEVAETSEGLGKAATAATKLEENAAALHDRMKVRIEKADALLVALGNLTAPDMTWLAAEEAPDLAGVSKAIGDALNGKIGPKTVETAEASVKELSDRLDAAKTLAKGRSDRVATAQSGYALVTRPEGGVDEDYKAYDADVPAITALESGGGDTEIAAAEAALTRLKLESQRLTTEFSKRAAKVEELKGKAGTADFTGIDADSGLAALETEQKSILDALVLPIGAQALEDLATRVTGLGTSAAEALGRRAATILLAVNQLGVSDEVPEAEAKPLKDRIDAIRAAATPPLSGGALAKAAADLDNLPKDLDAAGALIEDRKTRIAKAFGDVAKVTDPDKARQAEKDELDLLRKADALTPAAPFTEDIAIAATAAAKAVADKHAELVALIKEREDARAKALKEILSLAPPVSASSADMLKILKDGAALREKIDKAETLKAIEDEQKAIDALKAVVEDVDKIVKARVKAVTDLASAEALLKAECGNLFAGGYTRVSKMLADAGAKIDAGKTVKDFTEAGADIQKIAPYITQIKAYRTDLNAARSAAEFHINMMPTKSANTIPAQKKKEEADLAAQKNAMQALWHSLSRAADILAAQGDLVNAKKELDKFKTQEADYTDPDDPSVTKKAKFVAVTDPDATAFPGVVKDFMDDKYPIMDRAAASKVVVDVGGLKSKWGTTRAKGFSQQKWAEATSEVEALSDLLDECEAFLDAYEPYAALLTGATAGSDHANALDAIKALSLANDFTGALTEVNNLDALNGGQDKLDAAYQSKRRDLKRRVESVLAGLPGSISDDVSTPWTDAASEADHTNRMKLLGDVETALGPLLDLMKAREAARLKLGTLDPGVYKILDGADTLAAGTDVGAATAAYQAAEAEAGKLAEYLALKARLTDVKASYPATEAAAIKTADDALGAAETLATGQDLDGAKAELTAVLDDPRVGVLDKAITLFQKQLAKVKPLHDKVLGAMTHQASKDKLTVPWAAIEKAANTDRKYLDATGLLDAHVAVLDEARPYVDARIRATKALSGLDKIAGKVPPATKTAIYAPPVNKAALDTDLAAAEGLAAAGKFTEATKAFDDLVTLAKSRMKLAAEAIEELDHGHFLAGHGPDVPREETLARMTTGMRPDGEYAPSRQSSQFTDIGDFLACYDMAWEEAKAQKGFFGNDYLEAGNPVQVMFTMDAGKAIGLGVQGLTAQFGFDKGVEGPTNLFDTYEVTEGLDKLQVKYMFHFTHPNPSATAVITTFDKYIAAYKTANSGASPPVGYHYPGRWTVNQLLPTTG